MECTERGSMNGALAFSKKANGAGIQPIIATKLLLPLGDELYGSITLLAQNEQGYTNLCTLVSDSHTPPDDSTGKNPSGSGPTLDTAKLAAHADGLILLTGGYDGVLNALLRAERHEEIGRASGRERVCQYV